MSEQDINPLSLKEDLIDAILAVNNEGVDDDMLTIEAVGLVHSVVDIDNPMGFIQGNNGAAMAGVSYLSAKPNAVSDRGAGISTLQFVILINVSTMAGGQSSYENPDAEKANNLLYGIQRLMQGRMSKTGYCWMWGGHGLLPDADSLNDNLLVFQQVWEVRHGYRGYSG